MDGYNTDKIYEQLKIPERKTVQQEGSDFSLPPTKITSPISQNEGMFYEIEYDACPIPGVGKYVLKSQEIKPPIRDEIRSLFSEMKDIAKAYRSALDYSKFYDWSVRHDSARIFYKQGMFMKDFSDEYKDKIPLTSYYPCYQMMGYDQLRTYFTWRTEVRKGNVADTSLSYAFLYIYELVNNIGVEDPQDGLDKLMSFWKAFSVFNKGVDKYVLRWLKDYHIYYELPQSFKEFVDKNNLTKHYPKMTDDSFELFCTISKYDIRKSAFFTDERAKLIKDCFSFVLNKLRQICVDHRINFDDVLFQPTKKMPEWTPFKEALFCQRGKQKDRRIVLSENEIYICNQNKWSFSKVISSESGRQLIGYVMKQMESVLRKAVGYKHNLSANINTVTHAVVAKLKESGLPLDKIVSDAVAEFYREATKTVIRVDYEALSIIRQEALAIQEKLIVPEQEAQFISGIEQFDFSISEDMDMPVIPSPDILPAAMPDVWGSFVQALTPTETTTLFVVLHGEMGIKDFADECGIMPEVLVDGINQKAMDYIGDNIIDEEFVLYDDYRDQLKELVG